jgi:hypothetical protein
MGYGLINTMIPISSPYYPRSLSPLAYYPPPYLLPPVGWTGVGFDILFIEVVRKYLWAKKQ